MEREKLCALFFVNQCELFYRQIESVFGFETAEQFCFVFQITSYLFEADGVNATVMNVTFSNGSIITSYNVLTTTIVSSRTIAYASSQAVPYVIPGSVSVIAIQGVYRLAN